MIDRELSVPLSSQIYQQFRDAILKRRIPEGERLPSSRQLAVSLSVSRNTINTAYDLLRSEGLVDVRSGARPEVVALPQVERGAVEGLAHDSAPALSSRGKRFALKHRYSSASGRGNLMQPGEPSRELFPKEQWARSLRRAARLLNGDALGYEYTSGIPQFQRVLAQYLAQERGVVCSPEQVFAFPTVQSALSLMSHCFTDEGDVALIEEPGYLGARSAFMSAGLNVQPLSEINQVERASLIYVTPSHQYPTGRRMEMSERLRLLKHAQEKGAVVLEDDYDSEFLFEGRPIAALQGLSDQHSVIFIGTSAKSLMPGIRLAYAVVPKERVKELELAQRALGSLANVHVQLAFADFIESGYFRAHLNKIRSAYHENGVALCQLLSAGLGNQVGVSMPTGGLQMSMYLSEEVDDVAVADYMNQQGFGVSPLSVYYLGAPRKGLVVGFSEASEKQRERFVGALHKALALSAERVQL
ncbi:HTH-type transcriptional regulatory protein GabR [Pseudovibrio axinellae]|uniref:HTH-type transcriptional regulatory protein GabR n=2 Tax=Pseudovibrio axinellae TaxID=989403 RepID=A0A166ASR7_9HYPH|nr:HTH-type transcriptional regulatory protein GabR [Pseudovibrio axinellae]SER07487.1 GntR family transcriptional regulator / MocR family aminotransferase [Pseudovibrio axinellae]